MARIGRKSVEAVEEVKEVEVVVAAEEKELRVEYARKVNFENNPSLVGFFNVVVKGYPVFGKVSLIENVVMEDGKPKLDENGEEVCNYNTSYPYKKFKKKDGSDGKQEYIHPITKEVRQDMNEAMKELFEKVFAEEDKEKDY